MSAWWQKKVLRYGLRYALSQTGLLEDQVLDIDNFDISIGRQNIIDLKDVGLNLKRISQLAQLPPCLRLETARVLSLRLIIPADFYQSSIVVEVDGVQIVARLQEEDASQKSPSKPRHRSPETSRTPQHRKMNRRIPSPPPYDPGGLSESEEELHIPTTEEVAKSFIRQEPLQERRELEALVANTTPMDESFVSESSEGDDVGTGVGVGVPGFLAGFLQGILDRFKLHVKSVEIKVETEIGGEAGQPMPVTLRLQIGAVELDRAQNEQDAGQEKSKVTKKLDIRNVSIALLSDAVVLAEMSGTQSRASSTASRSATQSPRDSQTTDAGSRHQHQSPTIANRSFRSSGASERNPMDAPLPPPRPLPLSNMGDSIYTQDADHNVGHEDEEIDEAPTRSSILDIKPGDDNISWGSRRSQASAPSDDLWKSMVSNDDLPESLIIQPARASTPKALSSRGSSPSARRREAPNPHQFRSPGSWPRLDESPQRERLPQGPDSWPTADQSHDHRHNSLDQVLSVDNPELTDNKRTAFELHPDQPSPEAPSEPQEVGEDMMESRMYSHEEAQSMYMSAMTGSPKMEIPGGWDPESQSERSPSPEVSRSRTLREPAPLDGTTMSAAAAPSAHATPRAQSPVSRTSAGFGKSEIANEVRELVFIDSVSVTLPAHGDTAATTNQEPSTQPQTTRQSSTGGRVGHGMPGTFSAYSEMSSSRFRGIASTHPGIDSTMFATSKPNSPSSESKTPIDVTLGTVRGQIDWTTGRILHAIGTQASSQFKFSEAAKSKKLKSGESETPVVSLKIESVQLSFCEQILANLSLAQNANLTPALVGLVCQQVELSVSNDHSALDVGAFEVRLGERKLLHFVHDTDTVASTQILPESNVISVSHRARNDVGRRPIFEIGLHTARLVLDLDLGAVDETFDSFGGISGVLELGSSILSEDKITSPRPSEPPKGVRFAGDPGIARPGPEIKFNARVGGLSTTLRGPSCSVDLRSSTIKCVHREQGTSATVERILLSGPYLSAEHSNAPLSLDVVSVRVEYFLVPQDKDLERLLTLLTPSRDKYDNDDDILIDTLLRQRRKGAVLRVALEDVKAKVDNWNSVSTLSALSDDLAKLSVVAKYLPEDERPGILTFLRLKSAEAQLPVTDRFGNLRILAQDVHLAHVGLPALLAFSVREVTAKQVGGPQIVHSLLPLESPDNLPVIMARILGGEEEPRVKLKLFNLCVEYSVPIILALTNMDLEMEPEEMVNAMAQSVANLAFAEQPATLKHSSESDLSKAATKRTIIDVLVHDCALGLNPEKLSSKALLLLQDVHVWTKLPPEETAAAQLNLQKSALFICDQNPEKITVSSGSKLSTAARYDITNTLTDAGFAPVGTLMAASVGLSAKDSATLGSKMVEVDVKNELLLLETCADSLQTLIATLGALAPPTPPNRQPKYLTEPVAIEDLLSSFTGEEVIQPAARVPPKILFDAENDPDDLEDDVPLGGSIFDADPDDILAESAMTGSLYGPASGVFGMDDDPDKESTSGGDDSEIAESLLEDDPFEVTVSPDELLGDAALTRDVNRQGKAPVADNVTDFDLAEFEDLSYDSIGSEQQVWGDPHRFNAPYAGTRITKRPTQQRDIPFRLRLRDFHVIWHLYDGYDWQRTRDGIAEAVEQVEQRAEERKARRRQSRDDPGDDGSVIGDFLFNSIYIGVPTSQDAQDLRRQINRNIDEEVSETASVPASGISRPSTYSASGQQRPRQRRRLKLGRSRNHKITFELKGVSADVLVLPPGSGEVVSSADLRLKNFEIFDRVPSSTWRKFLTHMTNDRSTREMAKPMFHIQMENVKTIESHAATEIRLHVAVLPLRLHVDQDALDFITRFFEFKDDSTAPSPTDDAEKPYIQRIEVETVDLCLDYKPKNVDYAGLRSGKTTEFMNFVTLEAANIRLRHAIAYGVQGFDQLHPKLNDIWMGDVKRNQLPTILAGLAPVRSLVNLGTGIKDVVAVPIAEYKRHGRIVQSVQAGGIIFGKTTTSELARLGAKVAMGTQTLLTTAEQMLSPSAATSASRPGSGHRASVDHWHDVASASDDDEPEQKAVSAYSNQPLGLVSGLKSARRFLEHDLLTAKDALIAVQGEWMESRNPGEVAGAVARHAPTVILRPVIGATRAIGTTLLGVGNQIDRGNLRKVDDKYKHR